jgi:predicted homoserine dehydrogenase-like protein
MSLTRRSFLSSTAAGFVSARSLVAAQSSSTAVIASDRVRIGVIGTGRQGRSDMRAHLALPDVEIAAICDVDAPNLAEAAKLAPNAKALTDFRAVLDDKTIDAVIVGTPDHWHAVRGR